VTTDPPVAHRWFVADGLRLHALAFASGSPTLVSLHGVASHAWTWLPFASALGAGERCLAIDLRGHGDSQWSRTGDYATEGLSHDLEAVLDQAGASGVTVVGASWGGLVGLVLAVRRPDLIARLVLIDLGPSSNKDPEDVPPRPASFVSHEAVVAFEQARSPRADASTWERLAAHGTRPGEGGQLVPKHDPVFARRWAFRSEDHWPALSALQQPLLVVKAIDSPLLPDDVADRMASETTNGRVARIAATGHVVHVDDPVGLARLVRAFVAG